MAGESFNQLADLRKAMEENVTQNYLTPSEDMQVGVKELLQSLTLTLS